MNKLWYITKHRKIFKGKSKRAIQSWKDREET
jgi:hypothetical protein